MNKQPIPPIPQKNFCKVWFSHERKFTTGIVLNFAEQRKLTITEIAKLLPEAQRERTSRFYRSKFFATKEQAEKAMLEDVEYVASISDLDQERSIANQTALIPDDPTLDATDAAHPAWWRGYEYAFWHMCRTLQDILDGEKDDTGSVSPEPWQSIKLQLYALKAKDK